MVNKLLFISILLTLAISCTPFSLKEDLKPEPAKWESLFNGDNFEGWNYLGEGKWWIEDSMIKGQNNMGETSYIISERRFDRFSLQLDFSLDKGKGTLLFGVNKIADRVGGAGLVLNAKNGLSSIVGLSDDVAIKNSSSSFQPGKWNQLFIETSNDSLKITINGEEISSTRKENVDPGFIALQLPGDEESEIQFKNITIKELLD